MVRTTVVDLLMLHVRPSSLFELSLEHMGPFYAV